MPRFFSFEDFKKIKERISLLYIRNINFYLLVGVVALFLKWVGLRSWILAGLFSFCTMKYVFSIIRQIDKYFDTEITEVIEDDKAFYEGSFMSDLRNMINTVTTLLLPHFHRIINLSLPELISGIIEASRNQKPIPYNGELLSLDTAILKEIKHYSKMIVGAYGKKFNMKIGAFDNEVQPKYYEDSSAFEILLGEEAYIEFLLDHSGLSIEDLLYCSFEGDPLTTRNGVKIRSPPVFILRDPSTESIVVLIRGTQSLSDVVVDIYGNGMQWEEGEVHEGIGLIAQWIATDNVIHSTIDDALLNSPNYTLKVVGHSLGASIAALTAIYWHNHNSFSQYNNTKKEEQFLRCFAYAPPPVLSKSVVEKGIGFIYTIINEDDVVPRLSVECVYGAFHEIESYVEVEEPKPFLAQISKEKEKFRKSLQHVMRRSSRKEGNGSYRISTKSIFAEDLQSYMKTSTDLECKMNSKEEESSIYGDYVLPGSIYLFHPYIGDGKVYQRYEETKNQLTKSIRSVAAFLSSSGIPKAPGVMFFPTEEQFPKVLRLSPFITDHHDYRTYEESITAVLGNHA